MGYKALVHDTEASYDAATGLPGTAAAVENANAMMMHVNASHALFRSTDPRMLIGIEYVAAHESLHSAGVGDYKNAAGIVAYNYAGEFERAVFDSITGTTAALNNADHWLVDIYSCKELPFRDASSRC